MRWVKGQSGNPKGRPSGRISGLSQKTIAKLVGRDLPPSEMAAALLRRLFDIGCDPNNPVPVQIQAIGTALPYLAPRLQVTAQVTRGVGDFSDCKTVDELVERVEQDLGAYWAQLFRKAVASDDPGAVIDAEILSPDPTVAEQQAEPVKVEP
jgi:hypothetical protein